jgi:hypothetical protein
MTAKLAAHWQSVLAERLLTLHYEALVAAPEAVARRLLRHCGLPWVSRGSQMRLSLAGHVVPRARPLPAQDPAVLSFHTSNRTVATASVAQVGGAQHRGLGAMLMY